MGCTLLGAFLGGLARPSALGESAHDALGGEEELPEQGMDWMETAKVFAVTATRIGTIITAGTSIFNPKA